MANTKRFFNEPFDEGTKTKLLIFRLYAREWLPVFFNQGYWNDIHIYDFFCGAGQDSQGVGGSPVLILEELRAHLPTIQSGTYRVTVHLSDKAENVGCCSMGSTSISLKAHLVIGSNLLFRPSAQRTLPTSSSSTNTGSRMFRSKP